MGGRLQRREFLATVGGAGATGMIAGCTDLVSSGPEEVTLETDFSLPLTYRLRIRIETDSETISRETVMERRKFFLNLNEEEHEMPNTAVMVAQKQSGGNDSLGAFITADGKEVASSVTSAPYGVVEVSHSF